MRPLRTDSEYGLAPSASCHCDTAPEGLTFHMHPVDSGMRWTAAGGRRYDRYNRIRIHYNPVDCGMRWSADPHPVDSGLSVRQSAM